MSATSAAGAAAPRATPDAGLYDPAAELILAEHPASGSDTTRSRSAMSPRSRSAVRPSAMLAAEGQIIDLDAARCELAKVKSGAKGDTLAHLAARRGLRRLLRAVIEVSAGDCVHWVNARMLATPLHLACEGGHVELSECVFFFFFFFFWKIKQFPLKFD
jgi:hypothetical protein